MSANLDKFKPVTHLVFTTNALRNSNGDGTLNYYKRYESSYSNPIKKDEPFSANYPEFFYHGEITIRYVDTQDEVINKAKSTLSNLAITQYQYDKLLGFVDEWEQCMSTFSQL